MVGDSIRFLRICGAEQFEGVSTSRETFALSVTAVVVDEKPQGVVHVLQAPHVTEQIVLRESEKLNSNQLSLDYFDIHQNATANFQ